jgi:hypothetical protein
MFVAVAVAAGQARKVLERSDFPELAERAAKLYEKAFGRDILEKYQTVVNNTDKFKKYRKISYQHGPCHDTESFFWVTLYNLVTAWPEGEDDEGMTTQASEFLLKMQNSGFASNQHDSRIIFLDVHAEAEDFERLLHPRLRKLAPYLAELSRYMAPEWAYWSEDHLPADHCHEAMKRTLLKMLLELEDDPIMLKVGVKRKHLPKNATELAALAWKSKVTTDAKASSPSKQDRRQSTKDAVDSQVLQKPSVSSLLSAKRSSAVLDDDDDLSISNFPAKRRRTNDYEQDSDNELQPDEDSLNKNEARTKAEKQQIGVGKDAPGFRIPEVPLTRPRKKSRSDKMKACNNGGGSEGVSGEDKLPTRPRTRSQTKAIREGNRSRTPSASKNKK